jgi:hypothetical protein
VLRRRSQANIGGLFPKLSPALPRSRRHPACALGDHIARIKIGTAPRASRRARARQRGSTAWSASPSSTDLSRRSSRADGAEINFTVAEVGRKCRRSCCHLRGCRARRAPDDKRADQDGRLWRARRLTGSCWQPHLGKARRAASEAAGPHAARILRNPAGVRGESFATRDPGRVDNAWRQDRAWRD